MSTLNPKLGLGQIQVSEVYLKRVYGIPARMGSTRFPGKVLTKIGQKTLLERVWETVQSHASGQEVYICTDDSEIFDAAERFGAKIFHTSPLCVNGTEKMAQLAIESSADEVINVQADDPSIDITVLEDLERPHVSRDVVVTPIYRLSPITGDLENPNVVKVALANERRAAYFSRAVIPHFWDRENAIFWGHVGVYRYGADALRKYSESPPAFTELAESLEQLRFLSLGTEIRTVETAFNPSAIDSPEDLLKYLEN